MSVTRICYGEIHFASAENDELVQTATNPVYHVLLLLVAYCK